MSFDTDKEYVFTIGGVLIPFGAGHVFRPTWMFTNVVAAMVLIPFGAGHVFRRLRRGNSRVLEEVLIPFGAGHVFRPSFGAMMRSRHVLIPFGARHVFRQEGMALLDREGQS